MFSFDSQVSFQRSQDRQQVLRRQADAARVRRAVREQERQRQRSRSQPVRRPSD